MTGHPAEAELNLLADGSLEGEARAAVERHVAECVPCRRTVTGLQALLEEAARLPREIEPPSDLWASIATRLGTGDEGRGTGPRRRAHVSVPRSWLVAAAVVLVVLASGTAMLLLRDVAGPRFTDRPGPSSAVVARPEWGVVEGEYQRALDELGVVFEVSRPGLSPQTVAVVEANLRLVDQALAEARAALARDPASRDVATLVSAAYQTKIDLLRWARRVAAES